MTPIDCSEFLDRFSDFRDGLVGEQEGRALEEHHDSCESCRRYTRVLGEGVRVLRGLPQPELSVGFRSALHHRIRPLRVGLSVGVNLPHPRFGSQMTSGATMGAVAAIAVVLCIIAWSPTLLPSRAEVELPTIVVSAPPGSPAPPDGMDMRLFASPASYPLAPSPQGLWGRPHLLLYEHSPLSEQNRRSGLVRTALDQ